MKKFLFLVSLLFSLLSWGQKKIVKVGCSEYKAFVLTDDHILSGMLWDGAVNGARMQSWTLKNIVDVAGGQYIGIALDAAGVAYGLPNNSIGSTKFATDASGKTFDGNQSCYAFMMTYLTLKNGDVWMWGNNDYKMPGVSANPSRLTSGYHFAKLVTGSTQAEKGSTLLALDSAGGVWEFINGNATPRRVPLSGPATDIWASYHYFKGAIVGGQAYGWGNMVYYGGSGTTSTPSLLSGWPSGISLVWASWNTVHFLVGTTLYGMGDNSQGEVGIGDEWVNHAELAANPYVWDWVDIASPGGAIFDKRRYVFTPAKIGDGFTDFFTDNSYVFYWLALKGADLYGCGRNKSVVLPNGASNYDESALPNAIDITSPTLMKDPFKVITKGLHYTLYKLSAGPNQVVVGNSATLTATGTPTNGYTIVNWNWSQVSGPSTAILSQGSSTCKVSGLVTGVYFFRVQMVDNNGATISANTNVTVTVPKPKAVIKADSLTVHYPNTSFILSDASTASTKGAWSFNGATGRLTDFNGGKLLSNLSEGSYTVQLIATDDAGYSDTATQVLKVVGPPACPICPVCPPPVVCPVPRTVTGIQITLFGTVVTIPLAGTKIIFSDGSTQ